jgi:hypothetical protein
MEVAMKTTFTTLAVLFLVVPAAHGTPLTPGSQVVPSAEAALPAGSYIFSPTTVPISGVNALGETRFTGTLTFAVYRESATGFLDFLYQYHNDASSRDPVEQLSMTDFASVSTDVTHLTTTPTGFVSGTVIPTIATRSFDLGSVVSFGFPTPSSIVSGQTTEVLAINTNATQLDLGTTNFIDGGVASVVTRGPRFAPEPATLILFGSGLLSLTGFVRGRWWKKRDSVP